MDTVNSVFIFMKTKKLIHMRHTLFKILMFFLITYSGAQNVNVSGVVQDNTGFPIPGVNIIVKNTSKGAVTDFDGNFTITDVAVGSTLSFSYIGYKSYEQVVTDNSNLNIQLEEDLAQLDEIELARIRNQEIGFVFQLHHLLPQCTVLENVLVPTLVRKKDGGPVDKRDLRQKFQERAINLLQRVGLKDYLLYRPGELSGGQRQRVAVVRALINRPRLLLADEPTGSLDEKTSQSIADLLVELNRSEGVALIVVTHSLKIAERIGHVMELADGLLRDRSFLQ